MILKDYGGVVRYYKVAGYTRAPRQKIRRPGEPSFTIVLVLIYSFLFP